MSLLFIIAGGFLLDCAFGDPKNLPHPILYIGKLISWLEKQLYGRMHQFWGGLLLACTVMFVCFFVPYSILGVLTAINPILSIAVETWFCFRIFAATSLKNESMRVYHSLKNDDIEAARFNLSMIVGRETENLDEPAIARATVETVAENTTDGVIAPLIFMLIGGAPLAFLYKGINTMDSMIGYKNDRYILFGRAAAKIDDAANYIPARIAAWLMILASAFLGYSAKGALKIYKRDRRNHKSPNSAQTESVCAGALGIQLGGDGVYFGKKVYKPTIGDATREIEAEDISRANKLMLATSWLGVIISAMILILIRVIISMMIITLVGYIL